MSKFTPDQQKALYATGKTIVSASAGSGKTTVMIEKIINLIKDGHSVRDLLAVTFTKKAATQMKEKLSKALIKEINRVGTSSARKKQLKNQLTEVPNADISTIHSFCARLIRTYFYKADVDSGFAVINGSDGEGLALKNQALDELLEEIYDSKNADFFPLLLTYWRKKSDNTLRKIIVSTYDAVRDRADYLNYLDKSGNYDTQTFNAVCDDLLRYLHDQCEYYLSLVQTEKAYFKEKGAKPQVALCEELEDRLNALLGVDDYFDAPLVEKGKFTANRNSKTDSPEKLRRAEKLGLLKKKIVKIFDDLTDLKQKNEELSAFLTAGDTAKRLGKLVKLFDEKYSALKKEKGVLDYADLEHKAIELLDFPEVAEGVREKYKYVFVDEYQDVNPVQEAIISKISAKELFLVGDVKQSIYGFRGSKSKFFVEKQKEFEKGDGNSLYMKRNFRSSDAVLDAVNDQFTLAMTTKTSQVNYADGSVMEKNRCYEIDVWACAPFSSTKSDEKRIPALSYCIQKTLKDYEPIETSEELSFARSNLTDNASVLEKRENIEFNGEKLNFVGRVQVHFCAEEKKKKEEKPRGVYSVKESVKAKKTGVSVGAKLIKSIIDNELKSKIYDAETGEYRYARYADIAVLTRKKQGKISQTIKDLVEMGVPVVSPTTVNICQYGEIKTLIDILSLIDNAKQDIALTSTLLSPVGEFTVGELTDIRLAYAGEKYFRSACEKYAQEKSNTTASKLNRFYERYEKLRHDACVLDAGELLLQILTDYRMETALLSQNDGVACLKRIHRFVEEASTPNPMSMHEFLQKLRDLEYKIEYSENAGENSVKVLTMHASKGLEFPVVILDNLSSPFRGVVGEEVFVEENYGLAPKAYDTDKMKRSETLLRKLYAIKEEAEGRNDELNLYYVALTRAKYALHMIFEEEPSFADVRYAKSFADFTDFSVWEKYKVEDTIVEPQQERQALVFNPDETLARNIADAFLWEYAHTGYENLPVKSSATALMQQTPYKEEEFEKEEIDDETRQGISTSKEAGIAYHAFLENFDFGVLHDETGEKITQESLQKAIQTQYDEMQRKGEDTALLSVDTLLNILSNEAFYSLGGMKLYKERQFIVSLPIATTYGKRTDFANLSQRTDGEEMIFQGAIDLLAIGENEVRIIDYKYSVKDKENIKAHYKPQLDLYKQATAKILGVELSKIRASIINIYRGYQVDVD